MDKARPFPGFPARTPTTPVPEPFFTLLLPAMDDLGELKVLLYIFWRLSKKAEGYLSLGELMADRALRGLGEVGVRQALEQACQRGVLLSLTQQGDGGPRQLYFLNSPQGRGARERMGRGETAPVQEPPQGPGVFALYEQNIGLLTPLIAEELKEAEKLYPSAWIEEAIRVAVAQNKRRWSYVARILERWATEGKDGKPRRDSEKGADPRDFTRGKYGHLIRY